jgi:hypothetical protein
LARCCVCGNDNEKSFEVRIEGDKYVFDTFECAIHALAPACPQCANRIFGHGFEMNGAVFCSADCAEADARPGFRPGDYLRRPAAPGSGAERAH